MNSDSINYADNYFPTFLAPIPSLHTEVQQPFQGLSSSHIYDFLTFEIYPVTELMKFFSMPSYLYSMRRSVNDSINVNTFKDVSAAVFVYYWGPCKWRAGPYQRHSLCIRTGLQERLFLVWRPDKENWGRNYRDQASCCIFDPARTRRKDWA